MTLGSTTPPAFPPHTAWSLGWSCFAALLFAGPLLTPTLAAADDEQLELHREPISFTDVADAIDGDDPFDLNLSVGFRHTRTSGVIQREQNQPGAADGRGSANYVDIADYSRAENRLELAAEIGVFRDLSLNVGFPIVLGDDRTLTLPSGRSRADVVSDASGLFDVPFTSSSRSGIEHLELGIKWGVFNQMRDREYPTWVLGVSTRIGVGAELQPCNSTAPCESGVSEGTNALRLETRMSRRIGFVEPYAGLAFDVAFPGGASESFRPGGDLDGFLNSTPPRIAEFTAGAAVIPWQNRAQFQRLLLDFQIAGAYISEGHTYSPLFDALGTSTEPALAEPNRECPGCEREVAFTGLTDTQSHGRIRGQLAIEMQAARNLRFRVGTAFAWDSAHLITFADACNGLADVPASDPRRANCRRGIVNPHHRPTIDLPGRRFRSAGQLTIDLFASATAQF